MVALLQVNAKVLKDELKLLESRILGLGDVVPTLTDSGYRALEAYLALPASVLFPGLRVHVTGDSWVALTNLASEGNVASLADAKALLALLERVQAWVAGVAVAESPTVLAELAEMRALASDVAELEIAAARAAPAELLPALAARTVGLAGRGPELAREEERLAGRLVTA